MAISTRSTNFGTNSVRTHNLNRLAVLFFILPSGLSRATEGQGRQLGAGRPHWYEHAGSCSVYASVLNVVAPCNPIVILLDKSVLIIL
jgi:hypothetical protein